jgi:hypothetical protein
MISRWGYPASPQTYAKAARTRPGSELAQLVFSCRPDFLEGRAGQTMNFSPTSPNDPTTGVTRGCGLLLAKIPTRTEHLGLGPSLRLVKLPKWCGRSPWCTLEDENHLLGLTSWS